MLPASSPLILPTSLQTPARLAFAVGLGAAVPSLFAGRAPILILLLVLLIAGGLLLPFPPNWRSALKQTRKPFGIALIVMIGCWAVSAFDSLDPNRSPLAWLMITGLVILGPILKTRLSDDPELVDLILKILIGVSVIGLGITLVSIHIWPHLLSFFRSHTVTSPANAALTLKLYGSVLPLLLPVVVWGGLRLGGTWKLAAILYVPAAIAGVFAVGSKSGTVGLLGIVAAILIAGAFVKLGKGGRRLFSVGLLLLGGAVFIWVLINLPPVPFEGFESLKLPTWLIDAHRQVIWSFTLEHAFDQPLFGYGIRAGSLVPGASVVIPAFGQQYIPSHSHNWVFQLILETGFIGLLAGLVVLALLGQMVLRTIAEGSGKGLYFGGGWAAAGVAGAFFVSSLANFSFFAAWWQTSFVLLFSLCLACATNKKTSSKNSPNSR